MEIEGLYISFSRCPVCSGIYKYATPNPFRNRIRHDPS